MRVMTYRERTIHGDQRTSVILTSPEDINKGITDLQLTGDWTMAMLELGPNSVDVCRPEVQRGKKRFDIMGLRDVTLPILLDKITLTIQHSGTVTIRYKIVECTRVPFSYRYAAQVYTGNIKGSAGYNRINIPFNFNITEIRTYLPDGVKDVTVDLGGHRIRAELNGNHWVSRLNNADFCKCEAYLTYTALEPHDLTIWGDWDRWVRVNSESFYVAQST